MTTLDDRPDQTITEAPTSAATVAPDVAADLAVAEKEGGAGLHAEPRRGHARVARARARIATRLQTGGTWRLLPSLLDSRPRTLREQRDAIRAHRFDRPSPTGADVATWRAVLEHVYDAGMWLGFALKALFMVLEWCVERPRRTAVAGALAVALIHLF